MLKRHTFISDYETSFSITFTPEFEQDLQEIYGIDFSKFFFAMMKKETDYGPGHHEIVAVITRTQGFFSIDFQKRENKVMGDES